MTGPAEGGPWPAEGPRKDLRMVLHIDLRKANNVKGPRRTKVGRPAAGLPVVELWMVNDARCPQRVTGARGGLTEAGGGPRSKTYGRSVL